MTRRFGLRYKKLRLTPNRLMERIVATCLIEAPSAVEWAAAVRAGEPSSRTFVAVPGATDALQQRFAARVEQTTALDTANAPALPGRRSGSGYFSVPKSSFAGPLKSRAPMSTLVSNVQGNLYQRSQFSGVKLARADSCHPAMVDRLSCDRDVEALGVNSNHLVKMKSTFLVLSLAILGFAGMFSGCASVKPVDGKNAAALTPETVFITFHVRQGKETELQMLLAQAWKIYRHEELVLSEPHLILRGPEKGGTRMVEIFTWVNHNVPDHVPNSVRLQWNRMQALCEERDGHPGLEGGEVERVLPPVK